MPPLEISLSEQLKRIPTATRPTVKAAIRTVKAVSPTADEITYRSQPPRSKSAMWKLVRYAIDGANVVGVGTFSSHATLFFYRGRELDDGSGLLQGGGKDSRFITLRAPADAERPAVRRLVRQAFKLAASRDKALKASPVQRGVRLVSQSAGVILSVNSGRPRCASPRSTSTFVAHK